MQVEKETENFQRRKYLRFNSPAMLKEFRMKQVMKYALKDIRKYDEKIEEEKRK